MGEFLERPLSGTRIPFEADTMAEICAPADTDLETVSMRARSSGL